MHDDFYILQNCHVLGDGAREAQYGEWFRICVIGLVG